MKKHYQAICAFADGWGIEEQNMRGEWVQYPNPRFDESNNIRIIPDEDGWLPWYGGECPVDGEVMVEYIMVDDRFPGKSAAKNLRWIHNNFTGDIVKYRVVKQEKPKVKMRQWVYRDRGDMQPVRQLGGGEMKVEIEFLLNPGKTLSCSVSRVPCIGEYVAIDLEGSCHEVKMVIHNIGAKVGQADAIVRVK